MNAPDSKTATCSDGEWCTESTASVSGSSPAATLLPGRVVGEPLTDAAARLGVTYRQADFWCSRGYVNSEWATSRGVRVSSGGSGFRRWLAPREIDVFALMIRLVKAGLMARVAARVARDSMTRGHGTTYLGHGVSVMVDAYQIVRLKDGSRDEQLPVVQGRGAAAGQERPSHTQGGEHR